MVQLEGQAQAAQQKAMQADQERAAVQASLDKALAELAQIARRLSETDKTLAATQAGSRSVETGLAEAQAERTRLSTALDEANHKHLDEMNVQNSRFEALQARSSLTENLLEEARQTLMARADEIRTFERRVDRNLHRARQHRREARAGRRRRSPSASFRSRISSRRTRRSPNRTGCCANAVAARESAYNDAQEKIKEQSDLVQLLERQIKAARDANEMQIEQLNAQLQREQLERSMAEGALESGRKDIARLMREIAALQYRPVAATRRSAAGAAGPPAKRGLSSTAFKIAAAGETRRRFFFVGVTAPTPASRGPAPPASADTSGRP